MSCSQNPINIDDIEKPYFVWFEDNWIHDDELHSHHKGQFVYVESGFQYLTVEGKIYLYHKTMLPGYHQGIFTKPTHIRKR